MRINVYVDGLNLYKGALSGKPSLKWLDLVSLSKKILQSSSLGNIYFFTSPMKIRFKNDLSPERQSTYLRVLRQQGIKVVSGKTVKYEKWLRHTESHRRKFVQPAMPRFLGISSLAINSSWGAASPDIPKSKMLLYSEKASDVNLSSYLLRDSLLGYCDEALVISGDSDLFLPIAFSVEMGVKVSVAVPNKVQLSSRLKNVASNFDFLNFDILKNSQLPRPFKSPRGSLIFPPKDWI